MTVTRTTSAALRIVLHASVLRGGRHPDHTRPLVVVSDGAGEIGTFEASGPGWWGNAGDVSRWDRLLAPEAEAPIKAAVAAFLATAPDPSPPWLHRARTWDTSWRWEPDHGWYTA